MIKMTNGRTLTEDFKKQYNELIMEAFEFSFDTWFAHNVCDEDYESYSISENGVMLANTSVFKMKLLINDEPRDFLQFGAVATKKEYRGQGLSRKLIEHIFNVYPNVPGLLFAGDDVVNFYPKFGFESCSNKQPYVECILTNKGEMIKLNITDPQVDKYLKERAQYSKIFDCTNPYTINWFHILYGLSNNIYQIPALDVMVIARQRENVLMIYDIVAKNPVTFSQIVPHLSFEGVDTIKFGFNPDWLGLDYKLNEYKVPDSTFFVKGDLGVEKDFIFPLLIKT